MSGKQKSKLLYRMLRPPQPGLPPGHTLVLSSTRDSEGDVFTAGSANIKEVYVTGTDSHSLLTPLLTVLVQSRSHCWKTVLTMGWRALTPGQESKAMYHPQDHSLLSVGHSRGFS
jgi:hypothetical protein